MNDFITNGTEIKQRIISEINNASQCIYVAMAYFTDRDIAMAIIEAKNRNVLVDIILSSNAQNETVKLMFKGADVSVHAFETGDVRGIMHHKFCLIDNKISINGSYNYSINASTNNVENITVSDNLSSFSQMKIEFERLKYNIDNRIAVNETAPTLTQEMKTPELQPLNIIDTFSKQLRNLIYSSAQINTDEYKKQGYETSKKCFGSIQIFRAEYENIEEEIKAFNTDDSLELKKNNLTTNITNAFESTKTNLELEKQEKILLSIKDSDLKKKHINDKISEIQKEKLLLESGNQITGEKGLLQINKEFEKNKLEKRTLEESFVIKIFWNLGNKITTFLLFIFGCYLLVFFASALYKILFESNDIRNSLEQGINPGLPKLVDANAIITIFTTQGVLFGFMGLIFFLFPIMLSNIKLLGSNNKIINNLLFWIGLLIFDVIVAGMIAINTDEMKCTLLGKESQLEIWEVVKHGEFWMIFMFGMVPLIIVHYLIENISNAYKSSKKDLVDAEKAKKIQAIEEDMIELNYEKECTLNKIKEKDESISENKLLITVIESELNDTQNKIDVIYNDLQKQIKAIFDDYKAMILSGKIFTEVILDSVISSYKLGFIEYLPEYYATDEVSIRVKEIEQITNR